MSTLGSFYTSMFYMCKAKVHVILKASFLTLLLLVAILKTFGQSKMGTRFFTWEDFVENFGKEMVSAEDVHSSMTKSGLRDNSLIKMDFTFVSDKKENLERLKDFLTVHYPYTIQEVKKYKELWEVNGVTNEIPITAENLLYWGLDMYKRGYEFDSKIDAYGGPFDPKNQKYPDFNTNKSDYYFEKGVECYEKGDLSGSIINWSLQLVVNPNDPNTYYSRAIVKNELHTWKSALRDYDKAIEIAPNFTNALINRGSLKDENGDHQGAIEDYNKVLSIENVDLESKQQTYFNRGNSKFNLKDDKGACEDWEKAFGIGAAYAKKKLMSIANSEVS